MGKLKSGTTIGGNIAWHSGNDGSGSLLDADLLDGAELSEIVQKSDVDDTPVNGVTDAPISSNWAYDLLYSDQTFKGLTLSNNEADPLRVKGGTKDRVFIGLYTKAATQSVRSAQIGFSTVGGDSLVVLNEITDGELRLNTTGTGIVSSNGNEIITTASIDDTPVDGELNAPISSNWAYDHENDAVLHAGAYTHPSYTARTESGDTTALTGATVISDLDFNISSDSTGHITACDITTLATRNLTPADIGAATSGHTHHTFDYSTTISGATIFDEIDVTNGIVTNISTRELTPADIGAQVSGTYNTIIGTDTDLNTSGAQVIDVITMTDGVIQNAITTRDLTPADIGAEPTIAANTYEPYDLAIVKSDEAETITANWVFSGSPKIKRTTAASILNIQSNAINGNAYIDFLDSSGARVNYLGFLEDGGDLVVGGSKILVDSDVDGIYYRSSRNNTVGSGGLDSGDDLDTELTEGFYSWNSSVPTNAPTPPDGSTSYKQIFITNDGSQLQQLCWGGSDGQAGLSHRRRDNGSWRAWEHFSKTDHTHETYDYSTTISGATVFDEIDVTNGIVTNISTRELTLANLGYTGVTDANKYVHPTYTARTESGDTGALTGATVISDLDFNISSDATGHITACDITTLATRNLTPADIGAEVADTAIVKSDEHEDITGRWDFTGGLSFPYASGGYIPHPQGAFADIGSATGAIKIKYPTGYSADMDMFTISVFNYVTNDSFEVKVSGYHTSATAWTNVSAIITSRTVNNDFTVRFGGDTTPCIWIGETNTVWTHMKVVVHDFFTGYSSAVSRYDNGWAISVETSFNTVDETITDCFPVASEMLVTGITNQTALTTGLAGTDELLVSDNGVIKKMDVSVMNAYFNANLSFNDYTHPSHSGDDINVDTGALTGATVVSDIDFNVTTDTLGHVTDANGVISTRTLTLANLGYTGATNANNYVHPTYTARTESGDTGALTGATVISDLDFNITTNTTGHVTACDITTLNTRELTPANIGALAVADIDDTPVNAATAVPISSNWAYDHQEGSVSVHPASDITFDNTGTGLIASTAQEAIEEINTEGKRTVPLPLPSWYYGTVSQPANLAITVINGDPYQSIDFDKDTDEMIFYYLRVPKNITYNVNGTLHIAWYHNTATAYDVCWEVRIMGSEVDGETLGNTTSSNGTVTATGGTSNTLYTTSISVLMGNIRAEDHILLRFKRDANNVADTLDVDARLLSLTLEWTTIFANED